MPDVSPDGQHRDPRGQKAGFASIEAPTRLCLGWMARYWFIIVPVIVLGVGLPVLGARPFRFEEGRRVAQVLAILDGESWLRLQIFGAPYMAKPPMLPWLIALVVELSGQANEFAARLPGLLAVAASALTAGLMAFYAAGRQPRMAALAAGIFVMASPVVFQRLRLAETDAVATGFAAGAFLVWAVARIRGRGEIGKVSWCAIGACLGAALLTKGPPPILFSLLPMLVVPLRERRWRQLGALALTAAASALPLAGWLLANADVASVAEFSDEMRIGHAHAGLVAYVGNLPLTVVSGLLQFLPALIFSLFWLWRTRPWRRGANWLDQALFLFAVPASVALLLWPSSQARYIMPAVWPISVMAALQVERCWERTGMPSLLAAVLVVFMVIQGVIIARDGNTPRQVAERQAAIAMTLAFKDLPEGDLPDGKVLIWSESPKTNYNLFAYMGRNAKQVSGPGADCKDGAYLLAEAVSPDRIDRTVWSKLAEIEGDKVVLYARQAGAKGC